MSCASSLGRQLTPLSYHTARSPKRIYYFSIEWLLGRSLDNAVLNLGMKNTYEDATRKLGFNFEDLIDEERDAGLGNGGLGRLAACYVSFVVPFSGELMPPRSTVWPRSTSLDGVTVFDINTVSSSSSCPTRESSSRRLTRGSTESR